VRQRRFVKFWLRTRPLPVYVNGNMALQVGEFYCPWWAKPLDWVYDLIFGKVVLNGSKAPQPLPEWAKLKPGQQPPISPPPPKVKR
jgi:hypothetical protein